MARRGSFSRAYAGPGRLIVPRPDTPPPAEIPPAPPAEPRPATLRQVMGSVFWSFFGVRRSAHMQRDAVTVKPLQVIVVGVLLAAVLVLALLALVRIILSNAT